MPERPTPNRDDQAVEDWRRVRSEIEAENVLINNRQTWHIGLQTLITAAFFLVFSSLAKGEFIKVGLEGLAQFVLFVLAALGIVVSAFIQTAIRAALIQIDILERWWFKKYSNDDRQSYLDEHPPINGIFEQKIYKNFNPAAIPFCFVIVWTMAPGVIIASPLGNVVRSVPKVVRNYPIPSVIGISILMNIILYVGKKVYNHLHRDGDRPARDGKTA
jgi:hypothetical protein